MVEIERLKAEIAELVEKQLLKEQNVVIPGLQQNITQLENEIDKKSKIYDIAL